MKSVRLFIHNAFCHPVDGADFHAFVLESLFLFATLPECCPVFDGWSGTDPLPVHAEDPGMVGFNPCQANPAIR